jgi:hypothetical protein
MKYVNGNRYQSLPKRNFRNSLIRLLEENYKILGSHKVLEMIADDVVALHQEFYPHLEEQDSGHIIWRTTKATNRKPTYGTKIEDYEVQTVILPLITDSDVENRIKSHYSYKDDRGNANYQKQEERDIEVMARLCKSAAKQGGWLSGAELSVLLNRSLSTITRYMRKYHETHDDILPTKGIMLDQGSKPTHKASIIDLYEQGYPEVDIARLTNHTIESTSRYIKTYKNIKLLVEKQFGFIEMIRITGLGGRTITQYRDLVYQYHASLKPEKAVDKKKSDSKIDKSKGSS